MVILHKVLKLALHGWPQCTDDRIARVAILHRGLTFGITQVAILHGWLYLHGRPYRMRVKGWEPHATCVLAGLVLIPHSRRSIEIHNPTNACVHACYRRRMHVHAHVCSKVAKLFAESQTEAAKETQGPSAATKTEGCPVATETQGATGTQGAVVATETEGPSVATKAEGLSVATKTEEPSAATKPEGLPMATETAGLSMATKTETEGPSAAGRFARASSCRAGSEDAEPAALLTSSSGMAEPEVARRSKIACMHM